MGRGGEAVVMKEFWALDCLREKAGEFLGSGYINGRSEGVSRCRRWAWGFWSFLHPPILQRLLHLAFLA